MHSATIRWKRDGDFPKGRYSRAHDWEFDGGAVWRGSASPAVVRPPYSDPAAVDPEEAFVASISSCHMLWFLDLARHAGFEVDSYTDQAVGQLSKRSDGSYWMSRVELNPQAVWTGASPDSGQLTEMHAEAHRRCFIASSVRSEVVVNC